ncbi:MAG: tetratricopeptide repeat protein [Verrucomicrobia bacterium]|nr:tetratricopeptide repeat protein [Kiritimatiellia bacterium]MCP5487571.1 tetratricopeptide repeat protein [Verrucomicrobiota bacterium]
MVGLALFVITFLFYVIKAPGFAVPGRWAGMTANFSGLDPFRVFIRPVWSVVAWLVAALPVPNLGLAMNWLSAFLGAAVCWLTFEIVRQIPFARTHQRRNHQAVERLPRLMAGLFASVFVAASYPMMVVSTRGDYAVFDLFLLLLALYPAMLYLQKRTPALMYVSCFLYGLGMSDYPVMSALLPAFLGWWAVVIWKSKPRPAVSSMVMSGTLILAGFAMIILYAAVMAGSQTAMYREWTSGGTLFVEVVRLYFMEMAHSVPKVGWLLIFGMNILPFLFVMLRELDEPQDMYTAAGVYPFRLVLVVLAMITLFQLPGSPGRMMGPNAVLLAPVALVGVWFGFLLGYTYGILGRLKKAAIPHVFAAFWIVVFLIAGYRNASETQVGYLAPVADFADQVIANLDGRSYLVTEGTLDASLYLAARKEGVAVRLINLASGNNADRGRYHASLFTSPNLQNMARLGIMPLLREWLGREPTIASQVAFLTAPDIVEAHDLVAIPDQTAYRVARPGLPMDGERLFREHETYWEQATLPNIEDLDLEQPGAAQALFTVRWVSRLANDLGVLLEDQGQEALGVQSYQWSVDLWPGNMSATLNLLAQARRDGRDEDAEALQEQLNEQIETNQGLFRLQYLTQICGQVRDASAMLEEASILGMSGQSKLAATRMERAAGLIDQDNYAARLSLARLYLQGQKTEQGEELFRQMLESDPESIPALSGLLRVYLQSGQFQDASDMLDRLASLGFNAQLLALERANLKMMQGDVAEAKDMLLTLTKQASAPVEAWYSLGLIAYFEKDEALFAQVSPALELNRHYMPGMLLLGEWAMRNLQFAEARGFLEQVRALDPANVSALERLVLLAYVDKDADALRELSGSLLSISPNHPLGHYGAANVYLAARRFDLAEISLRRCLELQDFGPAHNDLAWILGEKGDLPAALDHAEQAARLLPGDPNVWDTLAGIYLKQDQLEKATEAIEQALSLGGDRSAMILLHAGQIYARHDRGEEAAQILTRLQDMQALLPPDLAAQVREFAATLKR